ncbi:Hsp20/alpha crystallin family protein [Halapricum desulfuricans]|nr:Hsp20/alpha crystallin family protein [Halapricum desulfuricans]
MHDTADMREIHDTDQSHTAPVDVMDDGDRFVVQADIPGYESEDIDLRLEDEQTLWIDVDEDARRSSSDTDYVDRQRPDRSGTVTVDVPDPVDGTEASATYERGVLTVRLPKADGVDGRTIEISER